MNQFRWGPEHEPDNWVDCPEMISPLGELRRCPAPAEILRSERLQSTDGPVDHIQTRCLLGHVLSYPVELLEIT